MVIEPDKSVEQSLFCGIMHWAVGVQGCQHGTRTEAEEQWHPNWVTVVSTSQTA